MGYSLKFNQDKIILELKSKLDDKVKVYYLSLENGDKELTLKEKEAGKELKFYKE